MKLDEIKSWCAPKGWRITNTILHGRLPQRRLMHTKVTTLNVWSYSTAEIKHTNTSAKTANNNAEGPGRSARNVVDSTSDQTPRQRHRCRCHIRRVLEAHRRRLYIRPDAAPAAPHRCYVQRVHKKNQKKHAFWRSIGAKGAPATQARAANRGGLTRRGNRVPGASPRPHSER
jgi:hypothetical protein